MGYSNYCVTLQPTKFNPVSWHTRATRGFSFIFYFLTVFHIGKQPITKFYWLLNNKKNVYPCYRNQLHFMHSLGERKCINYLLYLVATVLASVKLEILFCTHFYSNVLIDFFSLLNYWIVVSDRETWFIL